MQLEIGDMIHWLDEEGDTDLGWIIRIEVRSAPSGQRRLLYIQWVNEEKPDPFWEQTVLEHQFITIDKGGHHDQS